MTEDRISIVEPTPQHRIGLIWLLTAAALTVVLWQFPWGNTLLYPFSILATWFHEMGHGLTALILGGDFVKLEIFPNGSGVAYHRGALFLGRVGRALVSAGGPMGPAIAGAGLILTSRHHRSARAGLLGLGLMLLLSAVIWVRSGFGLVVATVLGIGILSVGLWAPRWLRAFTVQFLGVQACISTYHQIDYLFSPGAVIGGQRMLSDSSQIAQALLLPYWFWGGLMTIASLGLLFWSLLIAYRR